MKLLRDLVDTDFEHFLATRAEFAPFPRRADRLPWTQLPATIAETTARAGEANLDFQWPPLTARRYMDYARDGNRSRYEAAFFARRDALGSLVIAECIEADGRFLDQIVDGVWAILEESSWVVPAHNGQRFTAAADSQPLPDVSKRYVDLFAGQTGALLSWTAYLLGDALDGVTPLITDRIRESLSERIITPYMEHDDFWWMAFEEADRRRVNNWNPWCNSSCLAVALLSDTDESRRQAMVRKICESLDYFIDSYSEDGGCDEGPAYWRRAGASLFDCLELLFQATGGRVDLFNDERIVNIVRYIYRAQLADSYFVNFADCVPQVDLPAELVYRFGRRIEDPDLMAFGAASSKEAVNRKDHRDLFRSLYALFDAAEVRAAEAYDPLPKSVWFPGTQVAVARSAERTTAGFAVAAKGGHNAESHNHNDLGQVIVVRDGTPILIDPGVETYTAKTFSDRRYEIWTMQSAYHNLPTVGGAMQVPGRSAAARDVRFTDDGTVAELTAELGDAYPQEAGVRSWRRSTSLDRDADVVTITDTFELEEEVEVAWSFMLPSEPGGESGSGLFELGAGVALAPTGAAFAGHSVERVPIEDPRLAPHWGPALFRLVLTAAVRSGAVAFTLSAS